MNRPQASSDQRLMVELQEKGLSPVFGLLKRKLRPKIVGSILDLQKEKQKSFIVMQDASDALSKLQTVILFRPIISLQ